MTEGRHAQHGTALDRLWTALGGNATYLAHVLETGEGSLPSAFAVSDLASASVASAGLALAEFSAAVSGQTHELTVDRRLASLWFGPSLKPDDWSPPPAWDPIAGDYQGRDGWIRLHTNAPHHREAALKALGVPADKEAVARAVSQRDIDELEAAVVAQGGCAAAMRDISGWQEHDQGRAVAAEPLVHLSHAGKTDHPDRILSRHRPLAGLKVLDLTRVLAGPVATRFLASAGADVLRIDPPWWDEPGVLPDVTLGKRRARLDITSGEGRSRLQQLLAQADILVHGYRPDALEKLGLDAESRQKIRPGLIDVSLDAYGWTGPWKGRRGFDSLLQMSSGIAAEGMKRYGADRPKPLPVQALDHATGYLLAAAAIRGVTLRLTQGQGSIWCSSLARMASLLIEMPVGSDGPGLTGADQGDFSPVQEQTGWGPAWRLKNPLSISSLDLHWDRPAGLLGTDEAAWIG